MSRRYPHRHAPVRQSQQPDRLRRIRRDRSGNRGPGACIRDGLDQQERASVQGRPARRRGRGHGARDRRGPPPHLARHEAMHAEPVGRVLDELQEGRQGQGPDQVDHRFRRVHRAARRNRRIGAPFRSVLVADGRRGGARYKKGDEVEAAVLVDRCRARAHFARRQTAGGRPVQSICRRRTTRTAWLQAP